MARNNRIRIDSIEVKATQKNVVGGCGLTLFIKYLTRAGVYRLINDRFPETESNAGYKAEVYVSLKDALS